MSKEHAAIEVCNITCSHEASTKVRVFVSMQPVFIDLANHPTSGCSEVRYACQHTAIQPVGSAVTQLSL